MKPIIDVKNIYYSYGANEVLHDVSFSVEMGDYVALVGHNGSGKSTLVKLLLSIFDPSKGKIAVFGQDISKFSKWDKIGYLPQNIGIFNPLFPATVKEIVGLGLLSGKKFPKRLGSKDKVKINQSMEQMGITNIAHKMIGELSGGQIQRALLARAIVNEPEILFLDEPVSSVDAETRQEFFSYIGKLNKEKKTTIVLVTHDIGHSVEFTNKLLFLDKKVIFYGDYKQFCLSNEMQNQFGDEVQHIMCHQH